jgi:hypothetical protein
VEADFIGKVVLRRRDKHWLVLTPSPHTWTVRLKRGLAQISHDDDVYSDSQHEFENGQSAGTYKKCAVAFRIFSFLTCQVTDDLTLPLVPTDIALEDGNTAKKNLQVARYIPFIDRERYRTTHCAMRQFAKEKHLARLKTSVATWSAFLGYISPNSEGFRRY